MKKAIKIIVISFLFLAIFPTLAGAAVMALWNGIITATCGFAVITFWQAVGLFFLGQILTGGFLIALLFVCGGLHALGHHHGEWKSHWHEMTDEQRREFINRRRGEYFGSRNRQNKSENVAE